MCHRPSPWRQILEWRECNTDMGRCLSQYAKSHLIEVWMECMYIRGARYSTALYLDFDFAFVGCGLCLFTMQPWPRDVAWLCVCTHPRWQVVTSGCTEALRIPQQVKSGMCGSMFGTCLSKCEMSWECQAAFKSRIIFPDVVLEGEAGLYLFITPDTLA